MYLIVFVSDGKVTYWTDAEHLDCAEFYREDIPYHDPWVGLGYILTECPHHGWRPLSQGGICRDCDDLYSEFEFRQEADFYGPDTDSRA